MSCKELRRAGVLERVKSGELKLGNAAVMMGLSYRQTKRLAKRYRAEGAKGLKHGSAGRESNRKKPRKFRERVLRLVGKKYSGEEGERFGPTLAAEHLASDDHVEVNAQTLRRWMLSEGLWSRARKRRMHRKRRERKAHVGELVQMDGSFHDWLEGRGPRGCLMNMVDDASGDTLARMGSEETIWAAAGVLRAWVKKYGIPVALYTDWKNVYVREASTKEQLQGVVPVTQFGQITPPTQKIISNLNGRSGLSGGPGITDDTPSNLDGCLLRLYLYVICYAPAPLNGRNASIAPEPCFSAVRHWVREMECGRINHRL